MKNITQMKMMHDAEETYATHMEVEEENQPHSEEEDDDSYE